MLQVIFSIDGEDSIHNLKKFLMFVDNSVTLGKISPVIPCIGYYNGVLENSFIAEWDDFHLLKDWTQEQESILGLFSFGDKMLGQFFDPVTGDAQTTYFDWVEVDSISTEDNCWTYRKDNSKYYILR